MATPQTPLSAAAEEMLSALERSVGVRGSEPGDPLQWLSALLDHHSNAVREAGGGAHLEAVRTAVSEQGAKGVRERPFSPSEVAAQAGERASSDGRPIVSSQDVIGAVLDLLTGWMPTEQSDDTAAATPFGGPVHPDSGEDWAAGGTDEETLPASMAAEEMLTGLFRAMGTAESDAPGVFRWLDALLTHHSESVGGEKAASELKNLKEWGEGQEFAGGTHPELSEKQVRSGATAIARGQGRPIVTPQDLAMAIVQAAAEAVAKAEVRPPEGFESPHEVLDEQEPPGEESFEPFFEPGEDPEDPDATFEIELSEFDLEDDEADPALEIVPEDLGAQPEPSPGTHPTTRTFRLFVSSTFQDLQAERNVLQKVTFPRLRMFCARHGARFQAIDLRWGVSEEAGIDQQTMNICLGEIERCHRVTPRPNFLVLLGDRYGWLPPPPQIPAEEFEAILDLVEAAEDRKRLVRWYRKDLNADPPEYRLRP